jgi:hypothetical protein
MQQLDAHFYNKEKSEQQPKPHVDGKIYPEKLELLK